MTISELKKKCDKVFYYLNEVYGQAVNQRNMAIKKAKEINSILAATKISGNILEISKMHTMVKEKIDRETATLQKEIMAAGDSSELKQALEEQRVPWFELAEKIRREAESLNSVADDIASQQFTAFDSLEEYYKGKGLL